MITFQIDGTRYYINQDKRIEEVWLFGSYARGEQDCYSDIDLLIIVQDCSDMEYTELKTIVCRIAYSVRLDFFVSDEQDYRDGEKGGLFPVAFEAGRA